MCRRSGWSQLCGERPFVARCILRRLLSSGTRWVLIDALVVDCLERRIALRERSSGRHGQLDRGELLLAGTLVDPYDRALLVLAGDGPAVAAALARADPYVTHGLVTFWTVLQRNEVLEVR